MEEGHADSDNIILVYDDGARANYAKFADVLAKI
jgi:hypothetical protein